MEAQGFYNGSLELVHLLGVMATTMPAWSAVDSLGPVHLLQVMATAMSLALDSLEPVNMLHIMAAAMSGWSAVHLSLLAAFSSETNGSFAFQVVRAAHLSDCD